MKTTLLSSLPSLSPLLFGALLLAGACDASGPDSLMAGASDDAAAEADAPGGRAAERDAVAVAASAAGPPKKVAALGPHRSPPGSAAPVMPGARAAFEELTALVDAKYVDGPLSEDERWTAAMEGVLQRLPTQSGHPVNTLLSPRDHQELLIGSSGRLVGVGIMIERVADVVVVRGVVPGGPAEAAGLKAGDRILGIDGERIRSLDLTAVVDRIRGEDGTAIELFVQRDTEEWSETITRGLVEVPSVESTVVRDGVGYLRITSLSAQTTAELDRQLGALAARGATRLVLDLRHCPGGRLEAAVETSARFVTPGSTVLTTTGREGDPQVERSAGEFPSQAWPLAVLIGPKTASGAEIIADAVHAHARGVLLGEPTFGKHTIESIHELAGGWAVKLSVRRFATASGESRSGVGVKPDVRIPTPPEAKLGAVDALVLAEDPALAAAVELLKTDGVRGERGG